MSRSQISEQLAALLNATGSLGTAACIEGALAVEDYLTSGLPFPMAVVQTLEAPADRDLPGRVDAACFRLSFCAGAITEPKTSPYPGSGGSGSSQHPLERLISKILAQLNASMPGTFISSTHGFQGQAVRESDERLVVTVGKAYIVADVEVTALDPTFSDYYTPPLGFQAAPASSHHVTLSWRDFVRFDDAPTKYILRRGTNPGDSAPATVLDGVGITVGSGTATDATPSGSGQAFNYSLFRIYSAVTPGDTVSLAALAHVVTT